MNHEQHHRRLTRGAWCRITATAIALLLATASGCAVSENPRRAMPAAIAVQPPTAIVRPPAPLVAEAPVQQAAYVSPDDVPIPEPQSTAAVRPQVPSAVAAPSTPPQAAVPPLAAEELPAPAPGCTLTLQEAIAETLRSDPALRGTWRNPAGRRRLYHGSRRPPTPPYKSTAFTSHCGDLRPTPGWPAGTGRVSRLSIDWFVFGNGRLRW